MPDLTLPVSVMDVARIVGEAFEAHQQHARDRACLDAGGYFADRAEALRDQPTNADPLVWALIQGCHMQDGVIHAQPHVVAAVAYAVIAKVLAFGDPTRDPDLNDLERSRTEENRG